MIIRKSAFDKSENKNQQAYINAVKKLNSSGEFTKFINWHADMRKFRMHFMRFPGRVGMWRFLAWHRVYLVEFEKALRKYEPSVHIPYWKWVSGGVPDWMKSFLPTVNGVTRLTSTGLGTPQTITVQRNNFSSAYVQQSEIDKILSRTKFADFSTDLETGPHNDGHNRLGTLSGGGVGAMATEISPADPMFWLHHANVDRIWALWQNKNPSLKPIITGEGSTPAARSIFKAEWEMLKPFNVKIDKGAQVTNSWGYKYG